MSLMIGIDAGFVATGWVVADGRRIIDAGVIRTERQARKTAVRVADDDAERCAILARELRGVLDEHAPAGAVVELPTGGAQGARAIRTMGMATAVVVAVLELSFLPAEWVTPQMVKKASAGHKGASKEDVAAGVLRAFEWPELKLPKGQLEHVYDAAGCLLAAENGTLMRVLAKEVA